VDEALAALGEVVSFYEAAGAPEYAAGLREKIRMLEVTYQILTSMKK
jgi:hypothetical protein